MFDDIGAVGNGHDKLVLSFVSFCIVATSDYRREILGLVWSDFRRVILGLVWKKRAMPVGLLPDGVICLCHWMYSDGIFIGGLYCQILGDLQRALSTARKLGLWLLLWSIADMPWY